MSVMQLPLFDLPSDWAPPSLSDLPNWSGARRVGLDIETRDPFLKETGPSVRNGGYIVGVSFAIEDGPCHYLPFGHLLGGNLDREAVLRYLRDQGEVFKGLLVGANLNYDMDYLMEAGVEFRAAAGWRDIQVADPLINELHNSYSLDACLERHGLPKKDETQLRAAAVHYGVDPKAGLWKLHSKHVGAYAEWDARAPLQLLRKQEREIDAQELWPIFELECQVQPILLKMRRRGVRIDQDKLAQVEDWSVDQETKALNEIHRLTGHQIGVGNIWKKEAVLPALERIGFEFDLTPTGAPKLDKEALNGVDHPVAELIVQARKVNKLRTTFAQSIRNHMVNGRIHCTFNQLRHDRKEGDTVGARYGRLSSEHPNLQQQPSRDEFADMWRSIYVPDTDIWCCADYSQQEPRILTHYAEIVGFKGAHKAAESYRNDPSTDNHAMMTRLIYPELAHLPPSDPEFKRARTYCKNIYLGLCYGMGGAKLARDLGQPTVWITNRQGRQIEVAGPEAQSILDRFNGRAPFVKGLADYAQVQAERRGYIRTLLGRRCRFPQLPDGTYDWAYKALNRLVQGSAADQTKKALVDLDGEGIKLQLQVHDELDWSPESISEMRRAGEIMVNCVQLRVPSKVDLEYGPSWGEAKKKVA